MEIYAMQSMKLQINLAPCETIRLDALPVANPKRRRPEYFGPALDALAAAVMRTALQEARGLAIVAADSEERRAKLRAEAARDARLWLCGDEGEWYANCLHLDHEAIRDWVDELEAIDAGEE